MKVQQPETNLVFFNPEGAGVIGEKMVAELRRRGVLLAMMDGRIRACTHLDVTADMIEETVGLVRDIARSA
jgi:threonine aldolase